MTKANAIKAKFYTVSVEAFEEKMRSILRDKAATIESIEFLLEKYSESTVYKHDAMNAAFDMFLTGVEIGVALQGK